MGNSMDSPHTAKVSEAFSFSCGEVGAVGMQGWRNEMEDTHIVKVLPSMPDHVFFAVFDGHGGAGAAEYAEAHMVEVLENSLEWKVYRQDPERDPQLLGEALVVAFVELDAQLKNHQKSLQASGGAPDSSGCTAVTCVVTPQCYVCANIGDSRCVLGTADQTVPLSVDHKPSDEEEEKRVLNAGGKVCWKRIDGDLAVSRAFGDFEYKNRPDLEPALQKVSCRPDIRVEEAGPADDLLVLACDGLWDVMSSSEAVETVREILAAGEEDMRLVAEELVDLALNKGSRDNVSAVVLRLPAAVVGPLEGGGVHGRRKRREKDNEDALVVK